MYSIGLKRAVCALAALLVVTAIVLSVCAVFPDGAADAAVRLALTRALSDYTGLGSDRISVLARA